MKKKFTLYLAIVTFTFVASFSLSAQEPAAAAASPFKVTAELVSSYIWRGTLSTPFPTPNIQPTFSYVKGNFEIGAWGSADFIGQYKEVDLYASYAFGPLKLTITDYDWNFKGRYFNYKSKTTDHIFEGTLTYTGPESFPLSVNANLMFAGADKKYDYTTFLQDPSKQAMSNYIEFGYALKYISPFLGITASDGYYGDGYGGVKGLALVNLGFTATKSIKITDSYSLPLRATLGWNPQKEDTYLVFGITF
jgi:hypothetical protein